MSSQNPPSIPHFRAVQYGSVRFEDVDIPCAFGGEPGQFTALIMIGGVCAGIGVDQQVELRRIQENEMLAGGLYLVPFAAVDEKGRSVMVDYPAIALSRLHTWLALIPSELAPDEAMRNKLRAMKMELVDVLYGYFGRPLLPPDMRAEEDAYLGEDRRRFYQALEDASQLPGRVNEIASEMDELRQEVQRLRVRIDELEGDENIDIDQQEMLRAMIDVLARKYQEKHGQGTYGDIEKNLKKTHNFRYFKAIRASTWPAIVQDCVQTYYALFGRASRLPRVFELAQNSINQQSLF